jgi:hypothetical protein
MLNIKRFVTSHSGPNSRLKQLCHASLKIFVSVRRVHII